MNDTPLPKEELLIKMMGMTTSDNDNTALTAIRKANELLKASGWTWERVLQAKIKVVASPFLGTATPFQRRAAEPPVQAAPVTQPVWRPATAPQPIHRTHIATPGNPLSNLPNKFADYCYCCGKDTPANTGFRFDPWNFVPTATSKWQVACKRCNTAGVVFHYKASPQRSQKRNNVSDLA